jgi:hypothetical protein
LTGTPVELDYRPQTRRHILGCKQPVSSSRVDRSRLLRQVERKEGAHEPLVDRAMMLSGVRVRTQQVQLLASMLDGDALAQKLERGIANGNTIVALSIEDRHRIVAVLDDPPSGLAELQYVLITQLKKHKDREAQEQRSRLNQEMVQRRRERLG